jgi:tRNA(fMet)-specific endonuclease VapC
VKYLLDTNTCVHFLRYGSKSPVAGRLTAVRPHEIALCSVVLGELLYGALRSQDEKKGISDVKKFVRRLHSLPFDDGSAAEYASIRADLAAKGTPIGPNDLLIAAIALANRLTLATHNTGEFGRVVGLALKDWQI